MSYYRTIRARVTVLKQAHTRLSLPLPESLATRLDDLDQIEARAAELLPLNRAGLGAAAVAALVAGRDPASDKAVIREATRATLAPYGAADAVDGHLAQELVDVLRAEFPALVDAWRARFDPAAADVAEALRVLPEGTPLDGGADVSALTAPQLAAWFAGVQGAAACAELASAWIQVAMATRAADTEGQWGLLVLADLDADAMDAVAGRTDFPAVIGSGTPLSLPASAEAYAQRREALTADRARQQADADRNISAGPLVSRLRR